jgi:hypothetical protein
MDSDDDFNSVASSEDLGEDMSSSVDFGAAGKPYPGGSSQSDSTIPSVSIA